MATNKKSIGGIDFVQKACSTSKRVIQAKAKKIRNSGGTARVITSGKGSKKRSCLYVGPKSKVKRKATSKRKTTTRRKKK